jgi:hypothetical protein
MASPNQTIDTFAGVGRIPYTVSVSEQYTTNRIAFIAIDKGVITVRAKIRGNTRFEDVVNGTINLATKSTMLIRNYDIQEFEFTNSLTNSFTVEILQSEPLQTTS